MAREKKTGILDWQPKSESVDKLNDVIRKLTRTSKERGDPELVEAARQEANVSGSRADEMAFRGERVSNANRKVTAEQCQSLFGREKAAHSTWSYSRLVEACAEELGISGKQFKKYVKHPRARS